MMKRFCGTLLCLVMLLCVLTATAYGAGTISKADFFLSGYDFGVNAAGVSVEKRVSDDPFAVESNALYTEAVTEGNINSLTAYTGKIEAGKNYWLVAKLKANEGYTFADPMNVQILGYSGGSSFFAVSGDPSTGYAVFQLSPVKLYFSLKDFAFGKSVSGIDVTTSESGIEITEKNLYDTRDWSAVTASNISTISPTTDKVIRAKQYDLVVCISGKDGASFDGLTAENVYLSDYCEAKALILNGDKAYAVFGFGEIQATFVLRGYAVGEKVTEAYLRSAPTGVSYTDTYGVGYAFSDSPVTDDTKWNEGIISSAAATFESDKNYYLRLHFTSESALESAALKRWGGSELVATSRIYRVGETNEYYIEFKLLKLIGNVGFTTGDYQKDGAITGLTLTMTANSGISFTNSYDSGYFVFTNVEDYWASTFASKIPSGSGEKFAAGRYYYLVITLGANEGYDVNSLRDCDISLNGHKHMMEHYRTEVTDGAIVSYTLAFKLQKLDADYIYRVDATVTEPALGMLPAAPVLSAAAAEKLTITEFAWLKTAAADYVRYDDDEAERDQWDYLEDGETFETGYYYMLEIYTKLHDALENSSYELSPSMTGTINGSGEGLYMFSQYGADFFCVSRVFTPLEVPQAEEEQADHEPIHRQNTAANASGTTAPDTASKTDTVTSADTFDVGIALYAVLGALSLTGGAWLTGKKRS